LTVPIGPVAPRTFPNLFSDYGPLLIFLVISVVLVGTLVALA
jgi:hypothetical protein